MMKMLKMRMIRILIGLNSFIVISSALLLSGCDLFKWDDGGDYWYLVSIKNNTDDTLLMVFGEPPITDSLLLIADSSVIYKGNKVNKGQDVIREILFTGGDRAFEERTRILKRDSVVIDWHGPVEDRGEQHHFYNYNSWDSWLIDGTNDGIVQFVIYKSDFQSK